MWISTKHSTNTVLIAFLNIFKEYQIVYSNNLFYRVLKSISLHQSNLYNNSHSKEGGGKRGTGAKFPSDVGCEVKLNVVVPSIASKKIKR